MDTGPTKTTAAVFQKSLEKVALHLSRQRKTEKLYNPHALDSMVPSTPLEMDTDWHNATVFMATNVLRSALHLSDLEDTCYQSIESVWLSECKETLAYLAWCDAREEAGFWCDLKVRQDHYFEACAQIQRLLIDHRSKDRVENFAPIRDYIKRSYLDGFGRVDEELSDGLMKTKASRLVPEAAPEMAALAATLYTKRFYGNIIPAVADDDRDACAEVLRALQNGGSWHGFADIVNSFEAAIAISFLNPVLVHETWKLTPTLSRDTTF